MEEVQTPPQYKFDEMYHYARNLFMIGRSSEGVKTELLQKGVTEQDITRIVDAIEDEINEAKKSRAKKDMLYGALWCVGGLVLTMAHIGFIFWGAIVFGGIQFFKGVSNLN